MLLVGAPTVSAQDTPQVVGKPMSHEKVLPEKSYEDCGLRKRAVDAFVSHRPARKQSRQVTATFDVNYGPNFTPEARRAFDRAVEIWETHISSPISIRVQASYEMLGSGTLAAAGPNEFYGVDATGDGQAESVVGDALADALTETDNNPQGPDIIVRFNSQRDDWHFGSEDAPSSTIDFTSVALHELGHGLNFIDLFSFEQGEGEYFSAMENGTRLLGAYDRAVVEEQENGLLQALTNTDLYPNPSAELGRALESGRVFFRGDAAEAAVALSDGGTLPKLYAPRQYSGGSSIAHLDERTYPAEAPNALMTPQIGTAETNRLPGPIMCGQFRDMGWPLGTGCQQYFRDLFSVEGQPVDGRNGSFTLSWSEREGTNIQTYFVDRRYFDGSFEEIKQVDASEVSGTSLTVGDLGLGAFTFRLRWEREDGSTATSSEQVRDTVAVGDVSTEIQDRDDQGRGTIGLSWTVPPGTEKGIVYQVERRKGETGAFRPVTTVPQEGDATDEQTKQYTVERQTPGRYEYLIRAQDQRGNAVTSTAQEAQIDFEGDVYALGPYPNPVRETASFDLTARESQSVQVEVYNTLGKQVYSEEREVRAQDPTFLSIDTSRWASGVYFLRLRGEASVGQTQKMIVAQ